MKITQEGYDKLKQELKSLESVERPKIAKLLKDAIAEGDLSENAAYEEGKNRQSLLEGRVHELKKLLSSAKIENSNTSSSAVRIGSRISTKTLEGAGRVFEITDEQSADPATGKISYNSPMGAAFMGRKKGDKVIVATPGGQKTYILSAIN